MQQLSESKNFNVSVVVVRIKPKKKLRAKQRAEEAKRRKEGEKKHTPNKVFSRRSQFSFRFVSFVNGSRAIFTLDEQKTKTEKLC